MRKLLFWIHLAAGCVAGLVILIMSVSGVLLTYERQIVGWADRSYRSTPAAGTHRLPVDAILAGAKRVNTERPSAITLRSEAAAPAEVSFGRDHVYLVDTYSGSVLAESAPAARAFLEQVENMHRWLGQSGQHRAAGRAVTGASNLAFLVLVVSGPFLWLPRRWSGQSVRAVSWFRRGLQGRARDFNWHNVIGIWCAVPLLIIVTSGVVMSYPWANNLVYRITGNDPPVQNARPRPEQRTRLSGLRGTSKAEFAGLNPLWAAAERQVAGWKSITLRFPPPKSAEQTFYDRHRGWRAARSTFSAHAGCAHGTSYTLGAILKQQRRPQAARMASFSAYG